jgi:pimeloyl-ACP methyl ester carboxylesterase
LTRTGNHHAGAAQGIVRVTAHVIAHPESERPHIILVRFFADAHSDQPSPSRRRASAVFGGWPGVADRAGWLWCSCVRLRGMATFVLIHGGGGSAWDWHLLVPELAGRGHDVVVPELPIEDTSAGFAEFCATIVTAIGDRSDLVVVGHSYGALTAPLGAMSERRGGRAGRAGVSGPERHEIAAGPPG